MTRKRKVVRKAATSRTESRKRGERATPAAHGLAAVALAMREAARQDDGGQAEPGPSPRTPRGTPRGKKAKPATRLGKKGLVLYVEPEVTLALRQLALAHNTDVQTMGREALALLFARYERALPAVAPAVGRKTSSAA
jgi:hypothetical protein